jgi:hypothetical protein
MSQQEISSSVIINNNEKLKETLINVADHSVLKITCPFLCVVSLVISITGLYIISLYSDLEYFCSLKNVTICNTTEFYTISISKNFGYVFLSFGSGFLVISLLFIVCFSQWKKL